MCKVWEKVASLKTNFPSSHELWMLCDWTIVQLPAIQMCHLCSLALTLYMYWSFFWCAKSTDRINRREKGDRSAWSWFPTLLSTSLCSCAICPHNLHNYVMMARGRGMRKDWSGFILRSRSYLPSEERSPSPSTINFFMEISDMTVKLAIIYKRQVFQRLKICRRKNSTVLYSITFALSKLMCLQRRRRTSWCRRGDWFKRPDHIVRIRLCKV